MCKRVEGGNEVSTFSQKEFHCEQVFNELGLVWHLYTDGTKMVNVFCGGEEKTLVMTAIAVEEKLSEDIIIITFEIMENHLHMILAGEHDRCLDFFARLKRRIIRLFSSAEKIVDWSMFQASILLIDNLKSLRNEIVYVNRNAFVASPEYTPYNYLWGGGFAYFNPVVSLLPAVSVAQLGCNRARNLTKFRDVAKLSDLKFVADMAFIPSFCRIDIGEMLFRDARSYFGLLTRNAEAFSLIAQKLQDVIFMTDDELMAVAVKYASTNFCNGQLTLLQADQKVQIAKELHFKYNATNQQLRRMLKMDLKILQELFPI